MNRLYLVKAGKTFLFPYNTTTLGVFDTYEEADKYITKNMHKLSYKHMYIEPVEKISQKDYEDMMKTHIVIPVKGVE